MSPSYWKRQQRNPAGCGTVTRRSATIEPRSPNSRVPKPDPRPRSPSQIPIVEKGRFAAIDIGTNTILLLIAEADEKGNFTILEDRAEITRLGKGVDRNGFLSDGGQERSLKMLKTYSAVCRDFAVDDVVAVGTSALRDATNATDFTALVKRDLGWDLRILSGEEEARYAFLAVRMGIEPQPDDLLIADVGGGSTEFIWGRKGQVHRWASLQMGSVRLTERFLASDPVQEEECVRLTSAVDAELRAAIGDWARRPAFGLTVGIAGTFTTLAAIEKGLGSYSRTDVHGSLLTRAAMRRQIVLFKSQTVAQRKKIPGLDPGRADVILAGALLIERVMDLFHLQRIVVSDQGIRYGLLYERLARNHG